MRITCPSTCSGSAITTDTDSSEASMGERAFLVTSALLFLASAVEFVADIDTDRAAGKHESRSEAIERLLRESLAARARHA